MHTWIATPLLIFGNNKSRADLYPVTTSVLFKKKPRRFVNEQINSFPYSYVLHLNIEVKLIQSLIKNRFYWTIHSVFETTWQLSDQRLKLLLYSMQFKDANNLNQLDFILILNCRGLHQLDNNDVCIWTL